MVIGENFMVILVGNIGNMQPDGMLLGMVTRMRGNGCLPCKGVKGWGEAGVGVGRIFLPPL